MGGVVYLSDTIQAMFKSKLILSFSLSNFLRVTLAGNQIKHTQNCVKMFRNIWKVQNATTPNKCHF